MKIGPSSHNMYSNNILNFQESTTILNAHTKKSLETYHMHLVKNKLSKMSLYSMLMPSGKGWISLSFLSLQLPAVLKRVFSLAYHNGWQKRVQLGQGFFPTTTETL